MAEFVDLMCPHFHVGFDNEGILPNVIVAATPINR